MLDDLKMIHQRDSRDMLGFAEKQCRQLEYPLVIEYGLKHHMGLFEEIRNIVYAGTGNAVLAAGIVTGGFGYHVPFEVCQDYRPPRYVDSATLFVAADYIGDSPEVLSALKWAEDAGACVAVITAGGELARIAHKKRYPLVMLPAGLPPSQTLLMLCNAWIKLLDSTQTNESLDANVSETAAWLQKETAAWLPTVATAHNYAKQLAQEVIGKSIVINAGPMMFAAACSWKADLNLHARQLAWCSQYPEAVQTELVSWTKQPVVKPYAVIELRSQREHPRVQKSFAAADRLLSGMRPSPLVVDLHDTTILRQLLYASVLGKFVSLYLALLNGVDPGVNDITTKLMKEIA